MLKIICGRAKTGKSEYIYGRIREKMEQNEKGQILLVPDQYSHEYEVELLMECKNTFGLFCEVVNFKTLSNRVFESYGKPNGNILDDPQRSLLLYKAAYSIKDSLTYYGRFIKNADFTDVFLGVIDEIKAQNIKFEDIKDKSQLADKNDVLYKKLHDIVLIGEAYSALCMQNGVDTADILTVLSQKLESTDFLNGRTVYIDGFASFSPQEYLVIRQLIKKCKEVYVTLCLSDIFEKAGDIDPDDYFAFKSEPFNITLSTAVTLRKMALEENVLVFGVDTGIEPVYESRSMRQLEKLLANDETYREAGCQDGKVEIYSCANGLSECEVAASTIKKLVSDCSYRYNQIAVISYGFGSYENILPEIFRKYEIPLYSGIKSSLLKNPVVSVLLNALYTVCHNYPKREFLAYIKSGFSNISSTEADLLEDYISVWNLSGNLLVKRDDFTYNPEGLGEPFGKESEEKLKKVNDIRLRAIMPLEKLRKGLSKSKTVSNYIKCLCEFADGIELNEAVLNKAERFSLGGELELAEEYRQIWDKTAAALSGMNETLGECCTDEIEFLSLLRLMMSKYKISGIPAYLDCVTAGDASRLQVRGVKCTIILGVNDGVIPERKSDYGVFSPAEREKLNEFGLKFIKYAVKSSLEQQHSFYNAATSPSDMLVMTYRRIDFDGNDIVPSAYIAQISQSADGVEIKNDSQIPAEDFIWTAEKLLEAYPGESDIYNTDEVRAAFDSSAELSRKLKAAEEMNLKSHRKVNDASILPEVYGDEIALSASKIDRYNQCRLSYFAEYALKIKPRRKAEFDALKTGIFVHYMLEKIISEIYSSHGGVWDDKLIEELIAVYSSKFVDEEFGGAGDISARIRHLIKHQSRVIFKVVCAVLEGLKNSDFTPIDNELVISDNGAVRPLKFTVDSKFVVKVVGKIDRVDAYKDKEDTYIRIVDYKTGSKQLGLSKVANGLDMQMFIYLFSICENGKDRYGQKCIPAGVLYFPAANPIAKGAFADSEAEAKVAVGQNMRMNGFVLEDGSLIYAMDKSAEKKSKYIPVEYKKDGALHSSSSVLSGDEFEVVKNYTFETIADMGRKIFEGNIEANPYYISSDRTICDNCDFREVCRFDTDNSDSYRYLKQFKNKAEALSAMRGGEKAHEMD